MINSLEGGGAERVFSSLTSLIQSDANGDHIEVILIDDKKDAYSILGPATVHRIGETNSLLSFIKYMAIVKKAKPDYVVSFLTRANIYNVFGGFFAHYTALVSERSNTNGRLKGKFIKLKRLLVQFLYKRAAVVIAVSQGVKDCLVNDFNIASNKVFILNNAIDVYAVREKVTGNDSLPYNKYIVAMGRLVKTKGFDTLIKAYALSGVQSDLRILGDGPEKESLQDICTELDVAHKVYFEGFKSNPYPYIAQSEFFVLPSQLEGFPNSLVEALGLGKAVLSTDCTDGPREILNLDTIIEPGNLHQTEFGVIVNVNDIAGLAKGLSLLENDLTLRSHYEELSLKCIEKYSPEIFYANFKSILSQSFK
jgi:N-acetylgalactosamine-N,N'-diacetylbacillosaminyl-diphospho-undecaprenol 4-alpha-N-acetylgalactosaminyltransferase